MVDDGKLRYQVVDAGVWEDTLLASHGAKEVIVNFSLAKEWRMTVSIATFARMVSEREVKLTPEVDYLNINVLATNPDKGVTMRDLLSAISHAESTIWSTYWKVPKMIELTVEGCVTEKMRCVQDARAWQAGKIKYRSLSQLLK